MPTYNWLLTKFAKVIATIFIVWLFVVFIFSKKWNSLVIFQSLKWLRLNCENLEHPLISFDLPYNNFKADRIRLTFTKKLSSLLRESLLRTLQWNVLLSCNETWPWGRWTSSIKRKNGLIFLIGKFLSTSSLNINTSSDYCEVSC